ncbi:MAG: acyl-CoA dehydrogenase family protein, partial [Verrucomicrobia bacterium]|nr:acyl-CoA dehydrogenase family protein [Verrucomicrobiota bacterium]
IDTSKMSAAQREALELTESAREAAQAERGFAGGLFMGRFHLSKIHPFPAQSLEDKDRGDAFLERLETFLKQHVDGDEIDRTGEIPQEVFDGLAQMGAFGIKISPEYGGLGLSQTNYCRAAMKLGSCCGNLTALVSAHQSIGVPQPLILFGTEEQKRRYLPRVARGEISAFALTETTVGSDPAKLQTHAEPTADGEAFIINGEKLWCTNLLKAQVIVVMAKTPPKMVGGKPRNQITAFVVEMDTPGVEITYRSRFMGLKALYNGIVRFKDVRVPRENILLAEGKGLRVALTTLNTGRLSIPAACVGLSKRCLAIARKWASERVQWGAPIGEHGAIAEKLARIAADTFAMESMVNFAASIVDRDKTADVRLEAALSKLWATERSWDIVNDTMQIRGGRGYETAQSLAGRGEDPVPVERFLRDCRVNTIFEGSSEILRLFVSREALDPHLKIAAPILNTQMPRNERIKSAVEATRFYAGWYPRQWLEIFAGKGINGFHPVLARHIHLAANASHRLARSLFHAMAVHGPKLEREQVLLGRFVDIGAEILAVTVTCARAQSMLGKRENANLELLSLADYFSCAARQRIESLFHGVRNNADLRGKGLSKRILGGELKWLEEGII